MKIEENIPLAGYTTMKVGGPARYFCVAKSEAGLREGLAYARERGLPLFVLGGGSNLVVSDKGFSGLVIKMEIKGISYGEEGAAAEALVIAAAGESWDDLVADTVARGFWGLENLSAIPGTIGAAPVQNIGAYGSEAKDSIVSVRAINIDTGAAKTFANAECRFAYRDSFFKSPEGKKWIIVSVSFRLSREPKPNISYKDLREYFAGHGAEAGKSAPSLSDIRAAVIAIRSGKFPDLATIGTAGSFWKNPIISKQRFDALLEKYPGMPSFQASEGFVKIPLAWVLDKICGLKGYQNPQIGPGIALFEKQPLVLVAKKGVTASEIKAFQAEIGTIVRQKTGLEIEPEVVELFA